MSETTEAPVEEAPVEEAPAVDYSEAAEHVAALSEWASANAGDPVADQMSAVLGEWAAALGGDASGESEDVSDDVVPEDFSAASVFSAWKTDLNARREQVGLEPIA